MADLSITPVGAGIKPVPNMTLADMVDMARGAQAYQAQAEILPESITQAKQKTQSEASDLRLKMQKEKEYQTLIQALERNPRLFQDESGRFDINKVYDQMPKIAPLLGPELITKYQELAKSQSDVDKSITNLTQENREIVGRSLVGLGLEGKTKKQDFTNAFTDLQTQFKDNKPMQAAITNIKNYVEKLPEDANIGPAAISYGMRMLPVDKLKEFFPQLKTISTDAATFAGFQTQPITGAPPEIKLGEAPIAVSMPRPSDLVELTSQKDIRGIPLLSVKDAKTGIPAFYPIDQIPSNVTVPANVRDAIGNIRSQAAPAPAPNVQFVPPGETPDTFKVYQQDAMAARDRVLSSKTALNNIEQIRKILPLAKPGTYSEFIAKTQSLIGNVGGDTESEKSASALNLLSKYLADLAILKNQSLGGKYASDLQAAQHSLTTTESNPTAILESLKQFEPLMQHNISYANGLDMAISTNPKNYYIKPEFDRAMNEAFDIKMLKYRNILNTEGLQALDKLFEKEGKTDWQRQQIGYRIQRYDALERGDLETYKKIFEKSKEISKPKDQKGKK